MERDFMGLNSKEKAIETVLLKTSAVQWSLTNSLEDHNIYDPHGPGQLTVFYKGLVNVYQDISPEKAQAIMLLAHDGAKAQDQAQAHLATPRNDVVHASQPVNMAPSSVAPPGASTATNAPRMMSSLRRVLQSSMINGMNVPQMRESSLARFLEKRKERIMASAPYSGKPGSSSVPSNGDPK